LVPHEGSTRTYGMMDAVTGFQESADMIAAVGHHCGDVTVQKTDGSAEVFLNPKFSSWDYNGFVAKIDMSTGKAVWATNKGMVTPTGRFYTQDVATTAAGHVIVTARQRAGSKGPYTAKMLKYAGSDGDLVWEEAMDEFSGMPIQIGSDGHAYVTGGFTGSSIDKYGLGSLGTPTSCKNGEDSTAFIATFDVSGTAPVAKSMTPIGCGVGKHLKIFEADGVQTLYAAGEIEEATALTPATNVAAEKCTLTGDLGGYLAKFNKDGACVWAKDTTTYGAIATDGIHVWAAKGDDDPVKFSATLTMNHGADDDQIFGVKYLAEDGTALWASTFGGGGSSRLGSGGASGSGMFLTPTGPVFIGYSESEQVTIGDVTANNLQHARAKAAMSPEEAAAAPQAGDQSMLLVKISKTDKMPSCFTAGGCASGKIDANTKIEPNFCYYAHTCIANGDRAPSKPCFKCDITKSTLDVDGPFYDQHCFWDGKCHPKGEPKKNYQKYNQASVCEACQPTVKEDGYSLVTGHFHDRNFANAETGRCSRGCFGPTFGGKFNQISEYGVVFEMQSNGCQVMPEMTPTVTVSSGSKTVAQQFTEAIKLVNEATKDNKGAEKAWLYYNGNSATCNHASVSFEQDGSTVKHYETCENTPSHSADTYAAAFETNLYYGQSMARIKVQQGLVILQAELNNGDQTAQSIADLKQDIVAHMLITGYQVVIHSAHVMQHEQTAKKAQAKADGFEAWNAMKDHWTGDANDKVRLGNLFAGTPDTAFHYCTASELLKRNMPASSSNHYGSADTTTDRSASSLDHKDTKVVNYDNHAKAVGGSLEKPLKEVPEGSLNQDRTYLSPADLGILEVARTGSDKTAPICTFPPSPPPSPPPPPPPPLADQEAAIQKSLNNPDLTDKARADLEAELKDVRAQLKLLQESKDESSGLSDGEIAGVAVGAAVGGIVLLAVVGLILRSLLFKEAKPVFTCLEKAPAKK